MTATSGQSGTMARVRQIGKLRLCRYGCVESGSRRVTIAVALLLIEMLGPFVCVQATASEYSVGGGVALGVSEEPQLNGGETVVTVRAAKALRKSVFVALGGSHYWLGREAVSDRTFYSDERHGETHMGSAVAGLRMIVVDQQRMAPFVELSGGGAKIWRGDTSRQDGAGGWIVSNGREGWGAVVGAGAGVRGKMKGRRIGGEAALRWVRTQAVGVRVNRVSLEAAFVF